MARGEEVDWSAIPEVPDGQWGPTFRAGADELLAAMRRLPEDQQGSVGFQVAEYAVHSWDLCAGRAPTSPLDDSLAETGLAAMQQGLTDDNRSGAFGSEVVGRPTTRRRTSGWPRSRGGTRGLTPGSPRTQAASGCARPARTVRPAFCPASTPGSGARATAAPAARRSLPPRRGR